MDEKPLLYLWTYKLPTNLFTKDILHLDCVSKSENSIETSKAKNRISILILIEGKRSLMEELRTRVYCQLK